MLRSVLVLVAVAAVSSSCGACRKAQPEGQQESAGGAAVQLYTVRAETIRATLGAPGVVVPASARDWTIYATEPGEIVELSKADGDEVKTGDVLVKFQYTAVEAEVLARQTEVTNATGRVDAARAELAKMSAMFDRGYTARNTVDQAKSVVSSAELDLAHARQLLDAANAAAERATVRARFPGVVAKRFHNPGDLVSGSPTDPVLRVIDPTSLQVAVTITIQDLDKIQVGQPATIASLNGQEPGTVALRPLPEDPRAITQEIRVAFSNPSPALAVDSPVQVEILLAERQNVPAVPGGAILRDPDGTPYVMVAGVDGRAHRRDVHIGLAARDRFEIVAGVTPGDRVIASDPGQVTEGTVLADR